MSSEWLDWWAETIYKIELWSPIYRIYYVVYVLLLRRPDNIGAGECTVGLWGYCIMKQITTKQIIHDLIRTIMNSGGIFERLNITKRAWFSSDSLTFRYETDCVLLFPLVQCGDTRFVCDDDVDAAAPMECMIVVQCCAFLDVATKNYDNCFFLENIVFFIHK